jgi:hypothetical protein
VEYDTTGDGTIVKSEREPLHGTRRLVRWFKYCLFH